MTTAHVAIPASPAFPRKDFDRNFEQAMTPILLKAFQISVVSVFIFSF